MDSGKYGKWKLINNEIKYVDYNGLLGKMAFIEWILLRTMLMDIYRYAY